MSIRSKKQRLIDSDDDDDDPDDVCDESTEDEFEEQDDAEQRKDSSDQEPGPVRSKTGSRDQSFGNQAEPPRYRPGPACSKRKFIEANTNNQPVSPSPSPEAASSGTRSPSPVQEAEDNQSEEASENSEDESQTGSSEQNSIHQPISSTPRPESDRPVVQKSLSRSRNHAAQKQRLDNAFRNQQNGSKGAHSPPDRWESGDESETMLSTRSLTERTLPWEMPSPRESPVISGKNAPKLQPKPSPKDFNNESVIGTQEERTKFANVMRNYPNLYDPNHPSYKKDRQKKAKSWKAISKKLKMPVVRCRGRWKAIRQCFCHSRKQLAERGYVSEETKKFLEVMDFLPYQPRTAANHSEKSPKIASPNSKARNRSSMKVKTSADTETRSQSLKPDQSFLDEIEQQLQNYLPRQKVELKTKILRVFVKYNKSTYKK